MTAPSSASNAVDRLAAAMRRLDAEEKMCRVLGHRWIDARNSVVKSGSYCDRCGRVRP